MCHQWDLEEWREEDFETTRNLGEAVGDVSDLSEKYSLISQYHSRH